MAEDYYAALEMELVILFLLLLATASLPVLLMVSLWFRHV
jgi:hypothetical protein